MIRNKKLELDELFRQRKEVLSGWPTGKEINLKEAIEYRIALSSNRNWIDVLDKAKSEGKILIAVMAGHTLVEETLDHLRSVQANGADLVWLLPDTYTRRAMYSGAETAIQNSVKQGESLLNGYPIVNHGLSKARYIGENTDIPIRLVDGDLERCMLPTETGLAAGFEYSSNDVESLLRTSKSYPIEQKIAATQYQDRLAGYYTEQGASVMGIFHNTLSGCDPPEIKVAIGILHSLLAAEQGVKYISQEIALGCNLLQDVAGLSCIKKLTNEYLKRFGYEVDVSLHCFPFAGLWPRDRERAASMSALNVLTPILAGVDWFPIKSFDEAVGLPNKEGNLRALRLARHLLKVTGKQRLDEGPELAMEKEMMELGARAIIEKTLALGDGDAAVGQIKAIEQGVIDVAFSPNTMVKGKAIPLRDARCAIRYADPGNIPLPVEVKEYHRQKVAERERTEKDKKRYQMILEDIYHFADEPLA